MADGSFEDIALINELLKEGPEPVVVPLGDLIHASFMTSIEMGLALGLRLGVQESAQELELYEPDAERRAELVERLYDALLACGHRAVNSVLTHSAIQSRSEPIQTAGGEQ